MQRLRSAARILIKGQARPKTREIPAITPEEVAEAKLFFPLDKFFIFGHARSGTTLLTRLVRLHPKVHCNYQAHFFTRKPYLESLIACEEFGEWLTLHSNRWTSGRELSPVVLRASSDFILERDAHRAGKGSKDCIVGDKSPNSLQDGESVRRMVKVYPDARLIYIVRDGRDAIISHRFQTFVDRPQYLSAEGQKIRQAFTEDSTPFLDGRRSIFTEEDLRQAAEGWSHNVNDTLQAAQELLGENFYSLRYEDILAHTWETMSRLWQFLGVDPAVDGLRESLNNEMQRNPDAAWQQQKSEEIADSLQKGKHGTWRELFTARDREIFKQLAGKTLIDWGYEKDNHW
ncbi:MAG: sulfotransferase [Anaerolineales bacterium]